MAKEITQPDASPVVALILTLFVFSLGHWLTNGQKKKWIHIIITQIVVGIVGTILCGIPGIVMWILVAVDAMKTAERLNKGEAIPETEYSVPLLFKIMKIVDKEATCKPAEQAE